MRKGLLFPLLLSVGVSLQAQETPEFRCAQSQLEVRERDGTATLHIERTSGFDTPATGRFSIFPLSDVDGPVTVLLPFAPGVTSRSHDLPIDDEFYDGARRIFVVCDGFTGSVPPADPGPSSFLLRVIDDEPFPTVTATPVFAQENQGTVNVQFTITPPFANNTDIGLSSADDTAVEGEDYPQFGGVSEMSARTSTFLIGAPILNDDVAEHDERFRVNVLHGQQVLGHAVVNIIDDDRPPHEFTLDRLRYEASEDTPLSITVMRQSVPPGLPGTAVLHFSSPDHLQWRPDVPIHFAGNEFFKTIEVPLDDAWYTGDREGTVSVLINGFATDTAGLVVTENDPLPVLSIADAQVREGAAGATTTAEVQVTLSHPAGLDVHFDVTTAHGTAGTADYTSVHKSMFFAPGAMSLTVRVNVSGDGVDEPDETFTVSIDKCCGKEANLGTGQATVTIVDDDGVPPQPDHGAFHLEGPSAVEWRESQKWLSAKVVRADGLNPATITARLTLDAARQFRPVEVRFRAGETRKGVRFYIDDSIYSGDATGTLQLFDGDVREDMRIVTILEDEPRPVVSVADVEITEGSGPDVRGAFVLTVNPPSFQPIAMQTFVTFGPYTGDVRIPPTQPVVIPSLVTKFEVQYWVIGDFIVESDEWFQFQFNLPLGSQAVAGKSVAISTIHDDDDAPGRVTLAADRVERGGTVMATAIFREPQTGPGVISPSSPDGALGVPPLVEFPAGATRVEFPVQGLRRGETVLRVSFGRIPVVEVPLFVYSVATPVLPPVVRVSRGGIVSVPLSILPAEEQAVTVTITSSDPRIASVPPSVTLEPGERGSFEVVGAAMGNATLTITLPAELGGTAVQLPVEVGEPVSKRRSAR